MSQLVEKVQVDQVNEIARQWRASADGYAKWMYRTIFSRKHIYAKYPKPSCVRETVDGSLLLAHARGEITVGSYTTDPETDTVEWMTTDIDAHDDDPDADPAANEKYAHELYDRLLSMGFDPLVEDSNGAGGFHVWVFFLEPIPAAVALAFGRWLTRDHAAAGVKEVEIFPKQNTVHGKVGNQMRCPGRHHKRDHWSRVWDGERWLEGAAAVEYITARKKCPPDLIPAEAKEYVPPVRETTEYVPPEWQDYEAGGHWPTNYHGDLRTLDVVELFDNAGMLRSVVGGVQEVLCPWHGQHTSGHDTAGVWPAGDGRFPRFHCFHAHCDGRKLEDVLAFFGREAVDACCTKTFGDPEAAAERKFLAAADEEIARLVAETRRTAPAVPADPFADYRADPWYSYLWEGNHGEYVTDPERRDRIESIREVRKLIPATGVVPAYIRSVLPTTDADVIFHVAGAVALVAHLLNRRAWVQTGYTKTYPNLWVGCLGQSTKARKSSSINPVKHALGRHPEYARTVLPDTFTFESLAADLGFVLDPDAPDPGEMCRDKYEADPTGFLKGVGLFHVNEIGGFLQNMDRSYNQGGKATLTEWYDCPGEWKKSTRTQGAYYVWRPCVSILGASTLAWLNESSSDSDLKGGFLPRWLFFCGAGEKDYHLSFQDAPRAGDEDELHALVRGLIARRPAEMRLAKPALDWYDGWQRRFVAGIDPRLDSWGGRMVVHALKLAVIFAAGAAPDAAVVGEADLRLATGLIDRLADDLTRLVDFELAFGEEDAKQKKVLNVLRKAGPAGIDHSPLSRKLAPMRARDINEVVATLVAQDRVRVVKSVAANRKESHRYYLLR